MAFLNEKGSVMILSLWIFTVLVLLAGSLAYRSRIELRLSASSWDDIQLRQAAQKTLAECTVAWQKRHDSDQPASYPQGATVLDESSKINLNTASREVLTRLFASDAHVVPAIVEWRTPAASSRNAESVYARPGYECRYGPFKSLDELRLVKGMTPEIFERVEKTLTVYGTGGVNINTAPGPVLEALGLPAVLANKILRFRQGAEFKSLDTVVSTLKTRMALSPEETHSLVQVIQSGQLSISSDAMTIDLLARLDNQASRRYVLVASAQTAPARVLSWREYYR